MKKRDVKTSTLIGVSIGLLVLGFAIGLSVGISEGIDLLCGFHR